MVFEVLLTVVAPVFAVIAVGAALARRFRLDVTPVTRLAIYAAVPALVFRTLSSLSLPSDAVLRLVGAYGVLLVVLAGLAWTIGRALASSGERTTVASTLVATTLFANAANMMLPISLFAFGDEGLERALVLYVATALLMFALGPALVGRPATMRRAFGAIAAFPVLWAALAGVAASSAGVSLPVSIDRTVGLLADAAVPLVLLSLGIQVGGARMVRPVGIDAVALGLKLVVAPAVAFTVGGLTGLRGLDLAILTLLAAMPTAINLAMIAMEFGGDADRVARAVLFGTLASLVTLPVVLALLQHVAR